MTPLVRTTSTPGQLPRRMPIWTTGCVMALLCAAALYVHPAHAALWKWVDANGRVVYSDIPPSGDVKAEQVNGAAPPANRNAVKDMINQDAELKKRQMQRADDTNKADKARVDATRREDLCNQARGQLKALQMDNIQHVRVNERGERLVMDAAMRKQERDKVETFLRAQCQADR
ncbi:MAG: DUF4124 domain-containing protein [Casimicrobiaceae bacterium]